MKIQRDLQMYPKRTSYRHEAICVKTVGKFPSTNMG